VIEDCLTDCEQEETRGNPDSIVMNVEEACPGPMHMQEKLALLIVSKKIREQLNL